MTSNIKAERPGFAGAIYPINPGRRVVLGMPCFASLEQCPSVPELVVIVTPAPTVPGVVQQCVSLGVKSVIVISAGFKEIGAPGQALEDEIARILASGGGRTRLVGPNCFGIMDTVSGLNATFAATMYQTGNVAFLSQSGATMVCLMDWASQRGIGFRAAVSIGSMMDVNWCDLLTYLGNDPLTRAVVIYMESIGDARAFLAAAREVSLRKPIVVLKAGRTQAAAKAALSHTGSLAGRDEVLDEAFERAGVIRADTLAELMTMIEVLNFAPVPRGPNMVVVSHAGGPAVLAADALERYGAKLATVPAEVIAALDPLVPKNWSRSNPMDITGGALPTHFQACLDALKGVPDVDGVLVFDGPLALCPGSTIAQLVIAFAKEHPEKTVFACFMGGDELKNGTNILIRKGVPCFLQSDTACRTFATLWNYRKNVNELHAPPRPLPARDYAAAARECAALIKDVASEGRTILSESESKRLLASYGIPVSQTLPAKTPDEAARIATEMGFPVAVKVHSETVTHKSDVGGVVLGVRDEDGVRAAFAAIRANIERARPATAAQDFLGVTVQPMLDTSTGVELLLGAVSDAQFGPVIAFGTGGKLVEVYKDSALALPPLDSVTARRLMAKTKVYKALHGVRGMKPVDIDKLAEHLVSFSYLLQSHPEIKELDINPLFASGDRICAIDARVVLFARGERAPCAAIAPYPAQYNTDTLRVLRREDGELFAAWLKTSDRDALRCFLCTETLPANLDDRVFTVKLLYPEYDSAVTLAACDAGIRALVRVARLDKATASASYAVPKDAVPTLAAPIAAAAARAAKGEGYARLVTFLPEHSESARLLRTTLLALGYVTQQDGLLALTL